MPLSIAASSLDWIQTLPIAANPRSSSLKLKNTEWMEGQLSRVLDMASKPYSRNHDFENNDISTINNRLNTEVKNILNTAIHRDRKSRLDSDSSDRGYPPLVVFETEEHRVDGRPAVKSFV